MRKEDNMFTYHSIRENDPVLILFENQVKHIRSDIPSFVRYTHSFSVRDGVHSAKVMIPHVVNGIPINGVYMIFYNYSEDTLWGDIEQLVGALKAVAV